MERYKLMMNVNEWKTGALVHGVPLLLTGMLLALGMLPLQGGEWRDVVCAAVGERELLLDVFTPEVPKSDLLLVYVHGGAWRSGSKDNVPVMDLVERGYALASVDYRLSGEARFPANVHDIKAAIRFLRAKQDDFGIQAERIVILGSSAGGHLAALVGLTNNHPELEGEVGEHLYQSSAVQGIVSFYGASNLETILAQSTPHGLKVRVPALELLLGALPGQTQDLARLASPVSHVDGMDPPLLLIHGDLDPQMPVNQSLELQWVYEQAERPVTFINVHGGEHGGPQFYDSAMLDRVEAFLMILPAGSR